MHCDESHLRLFGVASAKWTKQELSLTQQTEEALRGGLTALQLRETGMNHYNFLAEAFELRDLCKQYHTPFFIADDMEVAISASADGLHVDYKNLQSNSSLTDWSKEHFLGVSVQTVGQALQSEAMGAHYLSVGPIFFHKDKNIGENALREIISASTIPVIAFGGINQKNLAGLVHSGIRGVAMGSGIFSSDSIETTCKQLFFQIETLVNL